MGDNFLDRKAPLMGKFVSEKEAIRVEETVEQGRFTGLSWSRTCAELAWYCKDDSCSVPTFILVAKKKKPSIEIK